jgi:hypothetical protein
MLEGKNKEAIDLFQKAIESRPTFYVRAYESMKKARAAMNTVVSE